MPEKAVKEDAPAGKEKILLSDYKHEHRFTDRHEIEMIAEAYHLGNPEDIAVSLKNCFGKISSKAITICYKLTGYISGAIM